MRIVGQQKLWIKYHLKGEVLKLKAMKMTLGMDKLFPVSEKA
jgi:hypothetical protein